MVFIQLSVLVLVYVWFCLLFLVFVSSYVYFVSVFVFTSAFVSFLTSIFIKVSIGFDFLFVLFSLTVPLFGFSVPFSNVLIFVCFVFRSGYVPHRNPRGRREKVAGLSSVPEHRAQGSVIMLSWDARTRHVFIVAIGDQRSSTERPHTSIRLFCVSPL